MPGFGASILAHTPKEAPGLPVRGILDAYDAGMEKVPTQGTIRGHLERMRAMGLVAATREKIGKRETVRYWRLVDSVFDSPSEAEA